MQLSWDAFLARYGAMARALASLAIDPLNDRSGCPARVGRGGGFDNNSTLARSAFRIDGPVELADVYLGLRPARALEQ